MIINTRVFLLLKPKMAKLEEVTPQCLGEEFYHIFCRVSRLNHFSFYIFHFTFG
jgi:hypothetical protein